MYVHVYVYISHIHDLFSQHLTTVTSPSSLHPSLESTLMYLSLTLTVPKPLSVPETNSPWSSLNEDD